MWKRFIGLITLRTGGFFDVVNDTWLAIKTVRYPTEPERLIIAFMQLLFGRSFLLIVFNRGDR